MLVLDVMGDARAASPGHRWELDLPPEPIEVIGDRDRLHQVLANLLTNARAHTPTGTTVRASLAVDGERFTRGDGSRQRASGSTGLGLSIVHAVTRAHGGEVDVASSPDGTVFTVSLPAD